MPRLPLRLGFSSGIEPSLPVSSQQLVNFYLHQNPSDAKDPVSLYGTPGLVPYAQVGTGPIRGMCSLGSGMVVVSGEGAYYVDVRAVVTFLGTCVGHGPASCILHPRGVLIASDSRAYVATQTTLSQLEETGLGSGTSLDGYAIWHRKNTQEFLVSGINAPLIYDDAEFTLASAYPDDIVRVIAINRELWVLKETSYEIFTNTGALDFPFQRINSAVYRRGCLAPHSAAHWLNTVVFVGDDKRVHGSSGYQMAPISTSSVDYVLAGDSDLKNAVGSVHAYFGHVFYTLTTKNNTFVYDFTTQLWHRKKSYEMQRWRCNAVIQKGADIYCGDAFNNRVYLVSDRCYTENSQPILRETISAPLFLNGERGSMFDVQVFFEGGVGLSYGQGQRPKAMLQFSDDGGFNWSSEQWSDIGDIGRYSAVARWSRLGQFKQRNIRVTVSDPVKVVITGGTVRVEAENNE